MQLKLILIPLLVMASYGVSFLNKIFYLLLPKLYCKILLIQQKLINNISNFYYLRFCKNCCFYECYIYQK